MESLHPTGCRVAVRIRGEVLFPAMLACVSAPAAGEATVRLL